MSKEIKIISKSIQDALGKIGKALTGKAEAVQIEMTKDGMLMAASSDNASVEVLVADCTGDGKFSVGIESLNNIVARRKELTCSIQDSFLMFKNGKYEGRLKIMPHQPVKVKGDIKDTTKIEAGSGLQHHFNKALGALNLSIAAKQDSDEKFMVVKVANGEMTCATYDSVHSAVYRSQVDYKGADMLFNFKTDVLKKVIDLGDREDAYSLKIGQNMVYIDTGTIKASINMTQIDAKSFETMLNIMLRVKNDVTARITMSSDKLDHVVTNLKAVFEDGLPLTMTIAKGEVRWNYETTYGRVTDSVEGKSKGKASIKLRFTMLEDVVGTLPSGDLSFGIVEITDGDSKRSQAFIECDGLEYLIQGTQ